MSAGRVAMGVDRFCILEVSVVVEGCVFWTYCVVFCDGYCVLYVSVMATVDAGDWGLSRTCDSLFAFHVSGFVFCVCIRLQYVDAVTCPWTTYESCSHVASLGVRMMSGAASAALMMCAAVAVNITHLRFFLPRTDKSVP